MGRKPGPLSSPVTDSLELNTTLKWIPRQSKFKSNIRLTKKGKKKKACQGLPYNPEAFNKEGSDDFFVNL